MRRGLSLYRFTASDGVSLLHVTLFNNKYAAAKIKKGEDYLFFGTVTGGFRRAEMASPPHRAGRGGGSPDPPDLPADRGPDLPGDRNRGGQYPPGAGQ